MKRGIVRMTNEVNYSDFIKLIQMYGSFRAKLLYRMGADAYRQLYSRFVSGQELTYHVGKNETFRHGGTRRHNAYFSMRDRKATRLTLRSNPMNLYERGFTQRNGRVERPRMVLTQKLPSHMKGRAEMIARQVDREIQDYVDQVSVAKN